MMHFLLEKKLLGKKLNKYLSNFGLDVFRETGSLIEDEVSSRILVCWKVIVIIILILKLNLNTKQSDCVVSQ